MKIVFFSSYYPHYLESFYKKHSRLSSLSYDEQMELIRSDFFGDWASYLSRFSKLGAEPHLIIPNCKPLQQAWARENNARFNSKDWQFSLPIEQVKKIKPDVFYIGNMFEYYGPFLDQIKLHTKKIFGWIACEMPPGVKPVQLELILSSHPNFIETFRKQGFRSEALTAAFDPDILKALDPQIEQDIDFSFVGNLTKAHQKRIDLVKALIERTSLQVYGISIDAIPDERNFLKKLTSRSLYQRRYKGETWGLDMYRTLKRSKITFNAHIDISEGFIGNMRMYEATGVGTLLLTDGKNAPNKPFNDDEVVYYENVEDAIDKMNYYLQHEKERNEIAERGQQRTLSDYSYEQTSVKLYNYFDEYLGK
jgi:glycosyltransferase involved in cell wall biosynthesis